MNTFITIENMQTGYKRCIEVRNDSREIYEIEFEGLNDDEIDSIIIYDINSNMYFVSKEMAKSNLIIIETIGNEVSN